VFRNNVVASSILGKATAQLAKECLLLLFPALNPTWKILPGETYINSKKGLRKI